MFDSFPHISIILIVITISLNLLFRFLDKSRGDWHALAAKYGTTENPKGEEFVLQGGKVGRVNYKNCLTINIIEQGFYISLLFVPRTLMPTLFIPWSEVINPKRSRFLWFEYLNFEIGLPPIATMSLPSKIFKKHLSF